MEERVLSNFSFRERNYLHTLRKRQREEISQIFAKRHKHTSGNDEIPFRMQVLRSHLPHEVKLTIFEDLEKSDHSDKFINWVRKAMRLPLNVVSQSFHKGSMQERLQEAKRVLDATSTGHDDMKREVLKLLLTSSFSAASYALGLEGPPGCGKTHFVKEALTRALGVPYVSIPLGGATDANFLLGSSYSYDGSKEGRLAAALMEAKCCNPIIHFDEVDKIPKTERGAEVESVLIHLVDPTNTVLRDKYFHGIDIDYAKCTFVFSYNDPTKLSPILLDRIKRMRMQSPDLSQRLEIVQRHIVPRIHQKYRGLDATLSDQALKAVTSRVLPEEGMRNVEKYVEHVLSSVHLCRCMDTGADAVGLDPAVELCKDGRVSGEFAEGVLRQMALPLSTSSLLPFPPLPSPPPPSGMYL